MQRFFGGLRGQSRASALLFLTVALSNLTYALDPVVDAIKPGCSTFTEKGKVTSSCWIGINPWEKTTKGVETISKTETKPVITEVWTASNTHDLGVKTDTITTDGKTVTSTSTAYVSFVTQASAGTGNSGDHKVVVIEGVVIAPALHAALQPVADTAAGKSQADIASEITSQLRKLKITLAAADVQKLAFYFETAAGVAVAAGVPFVIGPYVNNAAATFTEKRPASVTTTTSTKPTVTAIYVTPVPNWQQLRTAPVPSGTIPTEPHSDKSTATKTSHTHTSTASTKPPAATHTTQITCNPSNPNSFTLEDAQTAISKFCVQGQSWNSYATYNYPSGNVHLGTAGSSNLTDCKPSTWGIDMNPETCKTYFTQTVNDCQTGTTTKKFGGKLRWNGPLGCLDFTVSGWA